MNQVAVKIMGPAALALSLMLAPFAQCVAADERQSMEELRNTVINLLQALVEQGVITREKAEQMVKSAQDKAAASAAAVAKADEGAVRVPYVPQIVKDEIAKQVAETVKSGVVADVVQTAKQERWGVPAALPDWMSRISLSADVRLRGEDILFANDNQQNAYLDFNQVNSKGGVTKAGPNAFLNVDVNQPRLRVRARFGVSATFTDSITAGLRLTTGTSSDPISESQTLGTTGRYQVGLDQAFVRLDERTDQKFPWLSVVGGRFANPWLTPTDLVFHKELTFEGLAVTGRLGFGDHSAEQSHVFMTIGALPLQEIQLSSRDKWLYGGQIGTNLRFGDDQRLRIAAAYFDFRNVAGIRNDPNSVLFDYTAPQFVRIGNSLFDIRNDNDPTTNLFALASKFRLVNVAVNYSLPIGRYSFTAAAEGVKNIGFSTSDVLARTGTSIAPRTKGYQVELGFGTPVVMNAGSWRGTLGYRYLQRDAVLDSLTDSDFHGGGTDATGFYLIGEYGLSNRVWFRARYQSANEIDGPRLGVDTVQLDLNTQF